MKTNNIDYVKRSMKYTSKVFWETPVHKHSFYEVVIITMGSSVHYVNDKIIPLNKGDLLFMKIGDSHTYKIKNRENYLHYDFYISNHELKENCDYLSKDLFDKINTEDTFSITLNDNIFNFIIDKLEILQITQSDTNDERSEVLFKLVLTTILNEFFETNHKITHNIPEWYSKLILLVNKPEIICSNIENLVIKTNFSHGYLCKIFKKQTGEKLIDYFTKMKIDYSKILMLNKHLNILQISSMIGYDSLSHFIRVFKKYNILTPQVYRKNILNI